MDLQVKRQPTTKLVSSIIIQTRHLLHGRSHLRAINVLLLCAGFVTVQPSGVSVSTMLYGTVRLPCSFPFVHGPEGLTVVWDKLVDNKTKFQVYKFEDGKGVLGDQNLQFNGRIEPSKEFTWGNLDLVLREVTFKDEGTYICKAAHQKEDGDLIVDLIISGLNVTNPSVTFTYVAGDQYLLCLSSGVFQNLQVTWYDERNTNVSRNATSTISDLGGGMKMVESVLKMDLMPNRYYFCQIREGRLKRQVYAVISDGDTEISLPIFDEGGSGAGAMDSAPWISPWKIFPGLLACTTIRISIV